MKPMFVEVVRRPELGPCREWQGICNSDGYGTRGRDATGSVLVHRQEWAKANGPIPYGAKILHHCDNPPCAQLAHLYAGTQADNVRDTVTRGRCNPSLGEKNPLHKLTDHEVRVIRCSTEKLQVVADRYGIHNSLVSLIRHRKRRASVS